MPPGVKQDDSRGVLAASHLWFDAKFAPDRLQRLLATKQEVHPAAEALGGEKALGAGWCVVGGIDAYRDNRNVAAEPVERATDLLRNRWTLVLAGRVHEGDDYRLAAQGGGLDQLAILVAKSKANWGRLGPNSAGKASRRKLRAASVGVA